MKTIVDTKHVGSLRRLLQSASQASAGGLTRHYLSLHGYHLNLDILQRERKTLSSRVSELDRQIRQLQEKIASLSAGASPARKHSSTGGPRTAAGKKSSTRKRNNIALVEVGHG